MAKNNAIDNKSQELTIDPGASGDSFLQFDINTTGEFRIGVDDDDSDAFKISQGSALGTNDTFIMTAAGELTMPLQPSFLTFLTTTVTNVTGDGTTYIIVFDTEVFDQGGDLSGATFTAPITGRYLFCGTQLSGGLSASTFDQQFRINTSNRVYYAEYKSSSPRDSGDQLSSSTSALVDMDALDTANLMVRWAGGAKVVDIIGNGTDVGTTFSGSLIC